MSKNTTPPNGKPQGNPQGNPPGAPQPPGPPRKQVEPNGLYLEPLVSPELTDEAELG